MLLALSFSPSISTGCLGTGIPRDRDLDFDFAAATASGAWGVTVADGARDAGGGSGASVGTISFSSAGVLLRALLFELAAFAAGLGGRIAGLLVALLALAFAALALGYSISSASSPLGGQLLGRFGMPTGVSFILGRVLGGAPVFVEPGG